MNIALNRFKDRNIIFIFVVCTIWSNGQRYERTDLLGSMVMLWKRFAMKSSSKFSA